MTSWLKWRLAALLGAATLGSGATYLHAQSEPMIVAKTPGEASERFVRFITSFNDVANVRYHTDVYFPFPRVYFSVDSERLLKGSRGFNLLLNMAALYKQPGFDTTEIQNDNGRDIIEVKPSATPAPHQLVCVQENGGWRVDLRATYGKWTGFEGAALDKQIFELTGVASSTMLQDPDFQGKQCQSNLKQIMLGIVQYTQDYDELMPPARRWTDVIQPYVKSRQIFDCPAMPSNRTGGYAYNQYLSQVSQEHIEESSLTVDVYETSNVSSPNVFGPGTGRAYRHSGGANFAFADGHIKWFAQGTDKNLNFKP